MHGKYPTIKQIYLILPFTIYYLIEIMCSLLQNVNFATTTTNTERFVCNRQKIALNSVANLYVNSLPKQQTKHSLRREVAATDVQKISLQIILFRLINKD